MCVMLGLYKLGHARDLRKSRRLPVSGGRHDSKRRGANRTGGSSSTSNRRYSRFIARRDARLKLS